MTGREQVHQLALDVGTHNLHDETGTPTPFADVLIFTEAIPARVREALGRDYVVKVCRWQRDLVIAWRRDLDVQVIGKPRYRLVHPGLARVTPHRGTYVVKVRLLGTRTKLIAEHRINAAFPPFIRGESWLRPRLWRRHDKVTNAIIRRSLAAGWDVLAGGDANTPERVRAYSSLPHEVGDGFDRLGSNRPLAEGEVLARKGSDHHRLRASASLRKPTTTSTLKGITTS